MKEKILSYVTGKSTWCQNICNT